MLRKETDEMTAVIKTRDNKDVTFDSQKLRLIRGHEGGQGVHENADVEFGPDDLTAFALIATAVVMNRENHELSPCWN